MPPQKSPVVPHSPSCATPMFAQPAAQPLEYVWPSTPQTGSYSAGHTHDASSMHAPASQV
ncbi:hypothetical protein D3C83_323150 [compost metagenome]